MSSLDGQTPAFQQLTADNRGPVVVVASFIFFTISLLVVITRLITRFQITRKIAPDDCLIMVSTLLALAQTIALTFAANNGLGRHRPAVPDSHFDSFAKAFYAARLLAIPTLAFAKSSTNLLIMDIHPPRPIMMACKGTLAVTNTWAVAAFFATAFECHPPQVWDYQGRCLNRWALYLSNTVWNISTDLALVLLPFFLMRNVQVPCRKRWVVVGLFGCRIIVPAFSIAGAVATAQYWTAPPSDPTWHAVSTTLWAQAVINLSIITACIPCIKRFLADLSTGMMAVNISEPLELTMKNVSSSRNTSAGRKSTNFSSNFSISKTKSSGRSHSGSALDTEKKHTPIPRFTPAGYATNTVTIERSESVKGLTDGVIMQTIDYEVNYESARESEASDGSQSSPQLQSRPSQVSSRSRIDKRKEPECRDTVED